MSTRPQAVITRCTVISPRVRVPVLSVAMTEAEPRVSTEASFLTMAWWRTMRRTPIASTTDKMAGRLSGTAATASDTPSSSTVNTSATLWMFDISKIVPTTSAAISSAPMPSTRPKCEISTCSGVHQTGIRPDSIALGQHQQVALD